MDCVWGNWTEWSNCTATCGGGTKTKSREIAIYAVNGGQKCTGARIISQICNVNVTCNNTKGNVDLYIYIHIYIVALMYYGASEH